MGDAKRILIAGGTGVIGTRLTELLSIQGYQVTHLSRRNASGLINTFEWDIDRMTIDDGALAGVSAVINLAGASVAEKRWSSSRKQEILRSRTRSADLIFDKLKNSRHNVVTYISSSGIGYYGPGDAGKIFKESDPPGDDFLASVTREWERHANEISSLGIRVVILRTGVVLSRTGGALEPIARAVRWYAGSPLGSGGQLMSWIHIDDLCRIFIRAMEDASLAGTFNAVAPNPVTNREFISEVAAVMGKPLILPKVPAFVLRLMFGEMATMVLDGANVSAGKILATGFPFQFESLPAALRDLLK